MKILIESCKNNYHRFMAAQLMADVGKSNGIPNLIKLVFGEYTNNGAMEEDFFVEDMDNVFLGTSEEYDDPNTWTRQEAYLAYREACEEYEANWIGTPWYERTEDPPQWEDFWQD